MPVAQLLMAYLPFIVVIILLVLFALALVMAYGDLELESMVVEATVVLATQTGAGVSNLIEDVAGIGPPERVIPVGFTRKVVLLSINNPTVAAQTVTFFAADGANQERTPIYVVTCPAGVVTTVGLNRADRPLCKVQPDDITGVAVRWQNQLRANQTNIVGGALTVTARYYDNKYPY